MIVVVAFATNSRGWKRSRRERYRLPAKVDRLVFLSAHRIAAGLARDEAALGHGRR